jgi:serine/threonine protein kinase
MGDVYRAERSDGTFDQHVAVKIARLTLTEPEAVRRFRAERQILAFLQHPHIVTLIDGGTLPDGRPYLVTELVLGTPITAYCRDRALGLEPRLRLMRQVCQAVQYAHRHGIVHRDLKPANLLVDEAGVPRVLDFGVAKLLTPLPGVDGHTATAVVTGPLTPNYASPEQIRGLPVTTASDVYALGVLLYEIVAGQRPYETAGRPLDAVPRAGGEDATGTSERGDRDRAGRRSGSAAVRSPASARRSRRHRAEGDGKGAGAALRVGGGAVGRHRPLPRRQGSGSRASHHPATCCASSPRGTRRASPLPASRSSACWPRSERRSGRAIARSWSG